MKTGIDRILVWFKDGENDLNDLDNRYFPISLLLNRLMNEKYLGKHIKFININFLSEKTYELYPSEKYYAHYYGGHLNYDGVFDFESFNKQIGEKKKKEFIWENAFKALKDAAEKIKNEELSQAAKYAYKKGLSNNLNEDYSLLNIASNIDGKDIKASLNIKFDDYMHSILEVIVDDKVVFAKELDKEEIGMEYFLELYKKLDIDQEYITLKGKKEAKYLPLIISLDSILASS